MRSERARRGAARQLRDDRTGLMLTRWDPSKPWFAGDRRLPHERLKSQVISAARERSGIWYWRRQDEAFRRIVRVDLMSDGQYMVLHLEPLDRRAWDDGRLDLVKGPTIATTSLWIGTDRWGNVARGAEDGR